MNPDVAWIGAGAVVGVGLGFWVVLGASPEVQRIFGTLFVLMCIYLCLSTLHGRRKSKDDEGDG